MGRRHRIPAPQGIGPVIAAGEVVGGLLILVGLRSRWVAKWFVGKFLVTAFCVKLGRGAGWDAARIDLMMLAGQRDARRRRCCMLSVDQWQARHAPTIGQGEIETVPSA